MAHHERASIPAAVLVYRDKGPPEDVLVVIHHQIFFVVNGAPFSHVKLIECNGAFHRTALDHASHIPQLRYVERAPLHARQIPLQPGKQTTFELKQPVFLPG